MLRIVLLITIYALIVPFGVIFGLDFFLANDKNIPDPENRYLNSFDLYPYDGFHIQSNFHQTGFMYPWYMTKVDIKSGSHGYFIDFDLENPEAKADDEVRIILIGGSGAQGFGATENNRMMYKILENKLNELISPSTLKKYRVINLAMGGSKTYQNYVSLNIVGHKLDPDVILSYSGVNDFVLGDDASFGSFHKVNGIVIASRSFEESPGTKWMFRMFPNIMRRTFIGPMLKRQLDATYFENLSRSRAALQSGLKDIYSTDIYARPETDSERIDMVRTSRKESLQKVAIPQYINALKSIKRDFEGIPMAVVFQAMAESERTVTGRTFPTELYPDIYRNLTSELGGYMNSKWAFANFMEDARDITGACTTANECLAVHPQDPGQVILADYIFEKTKGFLRAVDGAQPNPKQ